MYTFKNDGPTLQLTNYFDSPEAAKGELYITTNAGCLRLLVPSSQRSLLHDMRCKKAYVSFLKNPDRIEIMFDDESANPFRIVLAIQQCDVMVKPGLYTLSVYVRLGEKYQFACEVKSEHGNVGNKNASKGGMTAHLNMRCSPDDKRTWTEAAKKDGIKLAEWVTKKLNSKEEDSQEN